MTYQGEFVWMAIAGCDAVPEDEYGEHCFAGGNYYADNEEEFLSSLREEGWLINTDTKVTLCPSHHNGRIPIPMYDCPICGQSVRKVDSHARREHGMSRETAIRIARGEAPVTCEQCGFISTRKGIHSHQKGAHPLDARSGGR